MKPLAPLSAVLLLGLCRAAWAAPVKVQVLGPGQKPVPGAQIRVRFWDKAAPRGVEPLQAVADAQGSAAFETPATAIQQGSQVGLVTAWSDGLAIGAAELRMGDNTVKLGLAGVARGLVVDAQGQPVEGASVRLQGVGPPEDPKAYASYTVFHSTLDVVLAEAHTDAAGRWSLGRVPVGARVDIELGDEKFTRNEAVSRPLSLDAPADWAPAEAAAQLVAAADLTQPRADEAWATKGILVARLGGSIAGRVVDPNGAPVAGVTVDARGAQVARRGASQATLTDARGEFRFARLGVDSYTLSTRASSEGDIEWVAGQPLKVTVTPGADVAAGVVKMILGGTIEVRVLDEDTGQGIEGVQVYGQPVAGGERFATSRLSDEQGRVRLRAAPGKHRLTLSGVRQEYFTAAQILGASTVVEVVAGQPQPLVLKLKKNMRTPGRIQNASWKRVPNTGATPGPQKIGQFSLVRSATPNAAGE